MRYSVRDLQAVEPDALAEVEGVTITVSPDPDSMGFSTVEVEGPTRQAVLDYVADQWGVMQDGEMVGDVDWFNEYVVARVREIADTPEEADRMIAYVQAARDLTINVSDSLPADVADINTVSDADEVLRELEDHAQALRDAKDKMTEPVREFLNDGFAFPDPSEVVARDYDATILCHLNVEVKAGKAVSVEGVENLIDGALTVGSEGEDEFDGLTIAIAMCEEV
jgi:molybdopterin converting factor small subunit